MKPDKVIPSGIRSRTAFANGMKNIRHKTFGTRNQNSPAMPFVYAFSAEVNKAGAQIHVAAMLMAELITPMFRFPTWKFSALVPRFVNSNVIVIMMAA